MFIPNRLFLALFIALFAMGNEKIKEPNSRYTSKIIKQNGVIKEISVANSRYRSRVLREGIIVKFTTPTVDIEGLQARYDIHFVQKLSIGYYIFSNQSAWDDYDLIKQMLEGEQNIHTIRPNTRLTPQIL